MPTFAAAFGARPRSTPGVVPRWRTTLGPQESSHHRSMLLRQEELEGLFGWGATLWRRWREGEWCAWSIWCGFTA